MNSAGVNQAGKRLADSMLRAAGGSAALFSIPATAGDTSDAAQIGADAPTFEQLEIAPAVLRRTRATMFPNEESRYELLVSAVSVDRQVKLLALSSAEALFAMTDGVTFAGATFQIESWSYSVVGGGASLFRLALRTSAALSENSA